MPKEKVKIRKEDLLTGFPCALEYLMEILFFYGTGVVLYGFWQGITGGYLTLFAGMVISGSFVFHILLDIFRKNRNDTGMSVCLEVLMEGILFSLLSFRMSWQAGVPALCGSVLILVIQGLLHGKEKEYVFSLWWYAFVIGMGWMALSLFQKGTITFADSVALLSGAVFSGGKKAALKNLKKKEKAGKDTILSVLLSAGNRFFLFLSLMSLSPLFCQILNQSEGAGLRKGYRMVLLWTAFSLILLWVRYFMGRKSSLRTEEISLLCAVTAGSVFLMRTSGFIGLSELLCFLALNAGLFLLHLSGHDSRFTWNLGCFAGSHISLIVMLVIVFQLYDGILVNYQCVLMTYFLSMAETVLVTDMQVEEE